MKYLAMLQVLSCRNAICAGSKETPKGIALLNAYQKMVNEQIEEMERGKFGTRSGYTR